MLAVALLTRGFPALPSMALASLVYLGLILALGALPREDLARLWGALRGAQA